MVQYDTAHVKNIALLGHAGCGKTTFAEAMLFESGILPQRGSVEEENTASDDHELEKNRHSSVFTSLLHIPWKGYKINILDTPGYSDFCGEVLSS
nr:GTP-binding protein [Sediminibacterium sp.]